jgi:polysaccharide export outer membrane protein
VSVDEKGISYKMIKKFGLGNYRKAFSVWALFIGIITYAFISTCTVAIAKQSDGGVSGPISSTSQTSNVLSKLGDKPPQLDSADYKLGPGDKIKIVVYQDQTLSGEFSISSAGSISFPLIGQITATDLTINQLCAVISKKLGDGYIIDPQVSGEVTVYRPFYILGEVNRPGEYPYASGLTAIKSIATAGGFTYRANHHIIYMRRSGEMAERRVKLTEDFYVEPGDIIRVVERHF